MQNAPNNHRFVQNANPMNATTENILFRWSTFSPWMTMFVFVCAGMLFSTNSNAQLTGTKNIPGDYATLAAAITALNTSGVGAGGVTFNVVASNPQTAPVGGYSITATGTSADPIAFTGNSNTVTAPAQTAAVVNDAIFKIIGGDYITIQGFTMRERVFTPVAADYAAGTNTMTEFGVALFYASLTNGAQNNTIQNNTISLNRTYRNTFGIYSNTRHSSTDMGSLAEVTSAAGSNSNNKVYTNTISNVNYGIVFIGAGTTIAAIDAGNDIGGSSVGTGNTITDWGGGAAGSTYISLTGSNYCIFVNQQINDNISYNTITSAALTSSVTEGGILKNYSVAQPTGTITTTINNNKVTITNNPSAAATGSIFGIYNQGLTTLLATATMSMNNNTVQNCVLGGATSTTNELRAITNLSLPGIMNMNGNSAINNAITATTATTGALFGISNTVACGTLNINNNIIRGHASTATSGQLSGISNIGAVVTAININDNDLGNADGGFFSTSTATSGNLYGIISSGGAGTCALTITGNDIRGITYNVPASAPQVYIVNTGATLSQNISSNTFTNLNVNTTGSVTFISNSVSAPSGGFKTINSNSIVTAFNKAGAGGSVTLYTDGGTSTATAGIQNNDNNFSNITVTGATTVVGWLNQDGTGGTPTKTMTGNTFSNWTCGTLSVTVLQTNNGNPGSITGNTITNIAGQAAVTGLLLGNSGTISALNLSTNTITQLSSTGTGGNVTGIQNGAVSTAPTVISNNIINGFSSTSTSATVAGITTSVAANIFQNTINTLSCVGTTSGVTNGIMITGGTAVNVYRNKIYDLSTTGAFTTAPGVNGILMSGGTTVNVYNNLVGDLKAAAANSTDAVRGLSVTSATASTSYKLYNNTVYLTGTGGTNFGGTGIFHTVSGTSTTAALDLQNNIIINNLTPKGTGLAVAFRRSAGAATNLANYAATSNKNLFYTGTPGAKNLIYSDGTSSAQTMAVYKAGVFTAGTIAPRDAGSYSEAWTSTNFESVTGSSANYLQPATTFPTRAESGGNTIAITSPDYNSVVRPGSAGSYSGGTVSDIGAWEFSGQTQDLTVTYNSQGGSAISSGSTLNGGSVSTSPGTPTKNCFTFNGWFETSTGGTAISFPYTHGQTANFTLYAQWVEIVSTPTITANGATTFPNGGSVNLSAVQPPLDEVAGATLAVGLRKLKAGYTGSALRLRRSTDNAEMDFGFVGNDLDVSAISTWLGAASGFCTKLYDQSGNSGHVTQTVAASQPLLVLTGINNKPVLRFTTAQTMFNAVNYTTPYSVVYGSRVIGTSMRVLAAKNNNWLLGYVSGAMDKAYFDGWVSTNTDIITPITVLNQYNVYAASGTGAISTFYKNGVQLFSNSGGLSGPNGIQLNGSALFGTGDNSNCEFTDVLIYGSVLAATDIGKLNRSIVDYYTNTNTYLWSTGATTQSISVSNAGSYTVSVTNANGCQSAASAATVVTVNLTVTYDSQGGSAISNGSTTTGGNVSNPGTPTRTGYTFNGWFLASSGGSAISFPYTHGQTANFTLYAQWTENTLTVTYDSQGGSAVSSELTANGGSISTSPGTPTRNCFTFNGWFVASTGGTAISFPYTHGQTTNFTLYAQWVEIIVSTPTITAGGATTFCSGGSVALTAAALPTTDLSFTTISYGNSSVEYWQSFTPTIAGTTTGIQVQVNGATNTTVALYVYDGIGTGGTLLYSNMTVPLVGSSTSFPTLPLPDLNLSVGSNYTFRLTGVSANLIMNNGTYGTGYSTDYGSSFRLNFKTNVTPTLGSVQWYLGGVTIPLATSSTYNATATGNYTVKQTNANGCQSAESAATVVAVSALPTAAAAGLDQTASATCGLTQVTLAGNTPSVGTGAWSIVSGTGGTITAPSSPTSTFTGTAGASYTLRWTISNSPCTASTDDVVIKFNLNPGNFGNALKFDGVNDYATNNASAINFSTNNEFTAEALVKFVPSQFDFWLTMRLGTAIKYRFGTDADGKLYWNMGQHGTGDRQYAGFTFTSDSWNHVAFTAKRIGTNIITSIYVNGILITTQDEGITTLSSVDKLNIGSGETGAHYFNGTIDEMRIWNFARTQSQIQASMNTELAGSETGLVAYYNFNQGTAAGTNTTITTLNDGTGNGYNGTLTNMTLTGTTSNWVTGNSFSIAAITGTSSVCSNGTSQMADATLGGVWSFPNSTYATVNTTGLVSGVSAGSPTLSYTLTSGVGCTSAATQAITVKALPTPTFTVQPGATACVGSDVTYTTQSGQTSYVWTIPGTVNVDYSITSGGTSVDNTVTLKWLTAGSKTVAINYTSNGCTAAAATSSTATTVSARPTSTFTAQPGATACANTDVTYTTQSGQSSYVWTIPGILGTDYSVTSGGSSADNTVTLKWLTTGSKTVTINYTNLSGCTAASATSSTATTLSAIPSTPTITAGGATTFCSGGSVNLSDVQPPLDEVAGATLAVGLRKLKAGYTGSALRLRRSTDNAESDFGFVGNDLDVSAISTWLGAASGFCTKLYDQSGNSGHVTQTVAASQPLLVLTGINSKPVLRFTTAQTMFNDVNYTTPYSVVYGSRVIGTSRRVLAAKNNNWLLGYVSGKMDMAYFDGFVSTSAYDPLSSTNPYTVLNQYNVYAASGTGAISTFYKNGVQLFSNSGGLSSPNGIQLNGTFLFSIDYSDCEFTDVLIYGSALAATDIGKLNRSIVDYYTNTNTYLWSTGATTQSISVSNAGSYTVRVTNANGCQSAESAASVVAVSTLPTIAAAGLDQISSATCGLTQVTLAGNTPSVGTGAWSIVSGTGGTITSPSSPTSTFTGTAGASYTLRWTISNSPCTASTDDVVITFNKNPTTANAGADQIVVASGGIISATLAGNSPTVGTGLWTIVSGSGGTITTPSSHASTFTGIAGETYILRWTISNSPCNSSSDNVQVSSGNVWTGNTSNLWNVSTNWSLGTVPTSTDIVIINTITPRAPQLNVDFTVGNSLTISGTGTLTVNSGKTLSVAVGGTADFGGKLVTFKSDATGSAQFGQMLGTLSNANNVMVERHIPASRRAFRLISSPVTTTSSIRNNWMEMENATLVLTTGYPYAGGTPQNPMAGYGTQITGSNGSANGFDPTGSNSASLFTHDNNGAGAWNAVTSTAGTLAAGDAYRILIRGDRGYSILASPAPAHSATTLRTNGTLFTGNKTVNLNTTANGFSMIGNPYQATVDMYGADITKTNITGYYYIWDPKMATKGAYVSYGGTVIGSNNVASAVNQYLQPGQAVFVQTSAAGAASIIFSESAKSSASNQTLVFSRFKGNAGVEFGAQPNAPQATYTSLNTTLYYTDSLATGAMPMDGLKVMFDNTFSNEVDQVDARKIDNLDETMSVLRDGTKLSIELMNKPDVSTVIPINITNYKTQRYTFRMQWTNPYIGVNNTVTAFLKDNYTGLQYEINNILPTDIPYTINATPDSYAANRFEIVFKTSAMVVLPIAEIALTAAVQQNGVKLQWTNPYDKDLSKYEVERSADGRVFTKLNTQSAGNGVQKNIIYNWFDATPIEGYNYYRIKGLALNNGKTQWSNNVKIRSWTLNIGTTIVPNPAERTGLKVKTDLPKGYYDMKLIDSRGRVVYTKGVEYNGLGGAIELRYGVAIAAGTYYLHIEGMGERVVRTAVVQ